MSEFLLQEHAADQELQGLFQQHLPLQPLPGELSSRLCSQVMTEVALHLRKRAFLSVAPLLAALHRLLGASYHRR